MQQIPDIAVNGESLGLGGYLDIGLLDTMEDPLVNMLGAVVSAVIVMLRSRNENARRIAERFIPKVTENDSKEEEKT